MRRCARRHSRRVFFHPPMWIAAAIVTWTLAAMAAAPATASTLEQSAARHTPASTATVDHSSWDRMLKAYVKPDGTGLNRVAYGSWKASDHKALKAYVAMLQKVDVPKLDRPEQFAYWANLYNAITIDVVLDKYPIKSIRDVRLGGGLKTLVTGGPWQANVVKVMGHDMSLDDIEHKVLRPVFKDPRLHYSVNCASIGCPNLAAEAYTGANLERLLEAGARAFVNSPRGFVVEGGKVVRASSIYSWFEADFGGSPAKVLDHARTYAAPDLLKRLDGVSTIDSYDYDWSLNDADRRSR